MAKVSVSYHRVLGVARDEKHLEVEPAHPGRVCRLPPVHAAGQAMPSATRHPIRRPIRVGLNLGRMLSAGEAARSVRAATVLGTFLKFGPPNRVIWVSR